MERWLRNTSCSRKCQHHIDESIVFDKTHDVPSSFSIGMVKGLGMSYVQGKVQSATNRGKDEGFGVSVRVTGPHNKRA